MPIGTVVLVGAGPGSVDLLTVAAYRAIQRAEIVFYDALIAADVRELIPREAQAVYVGKRCGQHAFHQTEINAQLIAAAHRGLRVVRLKGGDPLIFGRGGEEIAALRAAAVPYRIIPGISAFNGLAAAYALPLTLRSGSQELRLIQGHALPDSAVYWQDLAAYSGTLVIYMGIDHIDRIAENLLRWGAPAHRALAVIETAPDGHTEVTRRTLGDLQKHRFQRRTQGPGLIYIGDNVKHMDAPAREEKTSYAYALTHLS